MLARDVLKRIGDIGQERDNQFFGEAPVDVDKPFSPAARARAWTL
tara:strand:- start:328 stop:462 length:135 start_codon:yes stop_codon:yes gene_type:complete